MTLPTDDDVLGTSTGLAPNVAGALAYVLGPITGIAFLILEKKSRFVRFHAAQSTVVFVIVFALSVVLGVLSTALAFIPFLGWIVSVLLSFGLSLGSFVLWLALMWKAFNRETWELPIAGPLARRIVP